MLLPAILLSLVWAKAEPIDKAATTPTAASTIRMRLDIVNLQSVLLLLFDTKRRRPFLDSLLRQSIRSVALKSYGPCFLAAGVHTMWMKLVPIGSIKLPSDE